MKIILLIILLLAVVVFSTYAYYGGFSNIRFDIHEKGGEVLVYENYTGDYKNSGAVMDRIYYSLLEEHQLETYKGFGIYYDDPAKVEKSKLRSEVGCILENPDEQTLQELSAKYNIRIFPKQQYLTCEFPYLGKLSIFMGIMRVYPAMKKYIKANNITEEGFIMEIYDVPGKRIEYRKNI